MRVQFFGCLVTFLVVIVGCSAEHSGPKKDAAGEEDAGATTADATVESGFLDAPGIDVVTLPDVHVAADAVGQDLVGADSTVPDDSAVAPDAPGDDASAADTAGFDAAGGPDTATPDDAGAVLDATAGPDASGQCASDRECQPGYICEPDTCVAGCRVSADCPSDLPGCNTAAGPHGECVECTDGPDCEEPLNMCVDFHCTRSCSNPGDCPFPLNCDTDLGYCVRCIDDDQCPGGTICDNNACVEGCRNGEDETCSPGEICESNLCQPGCRATPEDTCPDGFHCNDALHLCEEGCGTSNDQCPENHTCLSNSCYPNCDNDSCPIGMHCDVAGTGVCLPGCDGGECGWRQVCDTTTNPNSGGECVECYAGDNTCEMGLVCDELNRECAIACNDDISIRACEWLEGGICDPDSGLCVDCLIDDDCGDLQHCDQTTHRCVNDTGRPLCASCENDGECGSAGDLCVFHDLGGRDSEQVCGIDCSLGQACPAGTECRYVGDPVVRGLQCYPINAVMSDASCTGYYDMVSQKACGNGGDCGVNRNDSICSGYGTSTGLCSVFCEVGGNDCPAGFTCEDPPPDGNRDPEPRCGP